MIWLSWGTDWTHPHWAGRDPAVGWIVSGAPIVSTGLVVHFTVALNVSWTDASDLSQRAFSDHQKSLPA